MSTPRDLREELVNSLSEGGGGGLRSGGEMGVASLLSPGQPRGEASEAVMRRRLGGDRPQLGSACQATSPGADRLGGGPPVLSECWEWCSVLSEFPTECGICSLY